MAAPSRSRLYLEHDLIGKPVSTFPGHALTVGCGANNTGFGPGFLNLPPCRSDCDAGRRNVSWRCSNFPTRYKKQGGNAMPSSRTIAANGLDFFVVEQGQGPLV